MLTTHSICNKMRKPYGVTRSHMIYDISYMLPCVNCLKSEQIEENGMCYWISC
jgi:hypothetical protein